MFELNQTLWLVRTNFFTICRACWSVLGCVGIIGLQVLQRFICTDFTFLTPECEPSKPAQETNYQASSNTNDPRFKNIYGVGITTSLNEDAEPNLDDPNPTLNNDPKVIDVGFHSPRLELQGRGVAGGRGGVQVASEIIGIPARTNTKTTTPKPEERTCPLCSVSFHGFLEDFEQHVDQCLTLSTAAIVSCDQERHCPMCSKVFPKEIPQSEFEGHVEHHFGNGGCDFEQLNIIGWFFSNILIFFSLFWQCRDIYWFYKNNIKLYVLLIF